MYYLWLFVSLKVSVVLTWLLFPKPYGDFPLFGDVSSILFIPAYFVLFSVILNALMWIIKNQKIKLALLFIVLLFLGVSSVLILEQNYSHITSYFLSFIGLIFGFFHYSISEVLRRRPKVGNLN